MTVDELKALIRTVPDFPAPGVQFRDITTLLRHGEGFAEVVALMSRHVRLSKPDAIAGLEARGFIFGAAIAAQLGVGFIPIRKPGKLPVPAISIDYALEYGTDKLELDPDAISPGQRVVLVDDLIATGGTALAATLLLQRAGAVVVAAEFVVELPDLEGTVKLRDEGVPCRALMEFPGH